ncbi:hypothetical protein WMF30_41420 [Sorangium sp. So ce134]|uniref:hypothetical protein n=1 Tax=Sorangium sp. So ce861 TaxID=3133323 RepID=UPI003F62BAB9
MTTLQDSRPSCCNCYGLCGTGSRSRWGRWWCRSCLPAARKPEKRDCACGCGAKVNSRFRPGHDARLKAIVMRVVRGEADPSTVPADGATREYLMLAPWVTKETAKLIGL